MQTTQLANSSLIASLLAQAMVPVGDGAQAPSKLRY